MIRHLSISLFLLLFFSACAAKNEPILLPGTPIPFIPGTITPTFTMSAEKITPVQPTATEVYHTVAQGDTLTSIASHYGISLEALLAANPGISPTALSIGARLVIPMGGSLATHAVTPTPASIPLIQARCWVEATGGYWCFALVRNDFNETIENISAQMTLWDSNGKQLASKVAWGLLDILPPGNAMPLVVHFPSPQPAKVQVSVQILTAMRLLPGDTRYKLVALENILNSTDAAGLTANVSGMVVLQGTGTVNSLWILAIAYDADGNVVGVRRLESTKPLIPQSSLSFSLPVYSVGPAIVRVDLIAEARP